MNDIYNELHFDNRIIPTFKKREKSFWNVFLKNTEKHPSNIAVTDDQKKISYQEMFDLVSKLSKYFQNLKLIQKDRICVLFENSWPLIVYILANAKNSKAKS